MVVYYCTKENVPETWKEFSEKMGAELNPEHDIRRVRDKLRELIQRYSVSKYL